jgi:hypothetical protein
MEELDFERQVGIAPYRFGRLEADVAILVVRQVLQRFRDDGGRCLVRPLGQCKRALADVLEVERVNALVGDDPVGGPGDACRGAEAGTGTEDAACPMQ